MKPIIHFSASVKSLANFPYDSSYPNGSQPTIDPAKIRPKGNFYFIRPGVQLKPDDWVIYGVASTNDVDLVDEVVDAEEVFSDSLEEFVRTGRIFWEHGYKLSGQADPSTMIDIAIGIPYMAEIYEGQLHVYILLDKSHPQSQKIWQKANTADERFSNQLGLSIGAMPQGKPKIIKHPETGKIVKKSPPMRLYEISVTGQPVNLATWAQALKSFFANFKEEDAMAVKGKAVTKAVEEEKNVELKEKDEDKGGKKEQPKVSTDAETDGKSDVLAQGLPQEDAPDAGVEGDSVDVEQEASAAPEETAEEGGAESAVGDVELGGEEGTVEGEDGLEALMSEEPGLGEGDTGEMEGLEALMGALSDESGPQDQGGDAALDLILDKVDMVLNQVAQLTERISKLAGAAEEEPGTDSAPADPMLAQDPMSSIQKSLNVALDGQDLLLEAMKETRVMVEDYKNHLFELSQTVKSLSDKVELLTSTKSLASEQFVDPVKEARKDAKPVTKSVSAEAPEAPVTVNVSRRHPNAGPNGFQVAELSGNETLKSLVARIQQDADSGEALVRLVAKFKSISGTPLKVAEERESVYRAAKELFGLDAKDFKEIVKLV